MTYAKQLKSIVGGIGFLHCLTCCNGKVYALVSCSRRSVIQVDIVVKGKEVVVSLLAFLRLPLHVDSGSSAMESFLRGYCKDLFFIKSDFDEIAKKTLSAIYLFKLDTTSMIWEEMEDLKNANDIRKPPNVLCLDSLYFKAPPTSPNCKVVGLSTSLPVNVFIYSLTWESWARYPLEFFNGMTPHSFLFTTLFNDVILALNQEALNLVMPYGTAQDAYMSAVVAEAPRGNPAQYFLVTSYRYFLLVAMDELGEFVEVFRMNADFLKWKKIDSLGRDMIYICGTTCLCMEAKTPEMVNNIYFPRLESKYGKIVFYSLETHKFHTLNGKDIQQCFDNFIGTKYYVYPHAWIQPSWS